jgi:hypothetical protein
MVTGVGEKAKLPPTSIIETDAEAAAAVRTGGFTVVVVVVVGEATVVRDGLVVNVMSPVPVGEA